MKLDRENVIEGITWDKIYAIKFILIWLEVVAKISTNFILKSWYNLYHIKGGMDYPDYNVGYNLRIIILVLNQTTPKYLNEEL